MQNQRLLREVAVTYSGQLFGSGVGFAIQLLLQRFMGPDEYGVLALASSTGALVGVFTDLGISHAMVRFASRSLSEAPEGAMARFAAGFWLRLLLSVLVVALGYTTAQLMATYVFHKPDLEAPLKVVYLGVLCGSLYGYWQYFIQTWQRFTLRSVLQAILALVKLVGFLLIWSAQMLSPITVILLEAFTNLLGFSLGMSLSPRGLFKVPLRDIRTVATREILPYCRFTGILILGDTMFSELDTFMLGMLAPDSMVGVFRCAWTYALVLSFLNMSVSNVIFPKVTALSSVAQLRDFMRRIVRFTVPLGALTLPVLPIVSWWIPFYQPGYLEAVPVFYVMYVGVVFELVVGPLQYVLYSLDRPGILVWAALFKIVTNIVGNALLIPLFGAVGAAGATVVTRVSGGLVTLYLIRRELKARSEPPAVQAS